MPVPWEALAAPLGIYRRVVFEGERPAIPANAPADITAMGGTTEDDIIRGVAPGEDGSVVLAGHTKGAWSGPSDGSYDFAAVKLDASGVEIWRWQGGSPKSAADYVEAVAAGPQGFVVLAGRTSGSWDDENAGVYDFAALVLATDASTTPSPTPGPNSSVDAPPLTPTPMGVGATRKPTLGPSSLAPALAVPASPSPTSRPPASRPPASPPPTAAGVQPLRTSTPGLSSVAPAPAAVTVSPALASPPPTLPGPTSPAPIASGLGTFSSSTPGPASLSLAPAAVTPSPPLASPAPTSRRPTPLAPAALGLGPLRTPAPGSASIIGPSPTAVPTLRGLVSPAEALRGQSSPAPTASGLNTLGVPPSPAPTRVASGSGSSLSSIFVAVFSIAATLAMVCALLCMCRRHTANDDSDEQGEAREVPATAAARPVEVPAVETHAAFQSRDDPPPRSVSGRLDVQVVDAIMEIASNLARQSHFPGVCEAATLVSTLVNLISHDRGSVAETESRLKRCRLLLSTLQRASTVLGNIDIVEGNESSTEMKRVLMENVEDAIGDMVGLIKTYRSKRRMTQVVVSTLFKRRMAETEIVVNLAFSDLMRWLQVDTVLNRQGDRDHLRKHRRKPSGARRRRRSSKESATVGPHLPRNLAEVPGESVASARSLRRQSNLDQIEIPEDHVLISEDILGKGGFGTVYIADYNGRNAAAKVILIDRDHRDDGRGDHAEDDASGGGAIREQTTSNRQRASLLLELQAMIRVRSPHTVNVYGAITTRKDRIVRVMELLTGGNLRSLLKHSEERLPEAQARRIIGDVCAGMTYLHRMDTIHGDIKSANVLLDGEGGAKIGDFGTSRWAPHRDETGLATHKPTEGVDTMLMISFAWAAPEVLNVKGSSYASDVYSFGIVAWEVLSMQVPWANEAPPLDIYKRVVFKGERPTIPADSPADIAEIVRGCWAAAPEERPSANAVMVRLRSNESQV